MPDDLSSISSILDALKEKTNLGRQLALARIWERWPELAGPDLCVHGNPRTVKDNTLIVECESTVWMHRFSYRKWDLVRRINSMAGQELISDIFLVLIEEDPLYTEDTLNPQNALDPPDTLYPQDTPTPANDSDTSLSS